MKILLLALIAGVLFGCSGAKQTVVPERKDIADRARVNEDFDTTWERLIDWFTLNHIKMDVVDRENGIIEVTGIGGRPRELDCGEMAGQISYASAKWGYSSGNLNIIVRDRGEKKTEVYLSYIGSAQITINNVYGESVDSAFAKCVSTGALEERIFVDALGL